MIGSLFSNCKRRAVNKLVSQNTTLLPQSVVSIILVKLLTTKTIVMSESSSKTTTELEVIKKWAEEREGKPSRVKSTADDEGGGLLRIDFPGYTGKDTLEEISWEDWYKTFQDRNLEFLYQDHTAGGKESRFFKLINKEK